MAGSFLLAVLLRSIGRGDRSAALAGAGLAIAFAWAAAAELGPPLFPPAASDNALFYMMAASLALAVPFDLFIVGDSVTARAAEAAVAIIFGLVATVWMR